MNSRSEFCGDESIISGSDMRLCSFVGDSLLFSIDLTFPRTLFADIFFFAVFKETAFGYKLFERCRKHFS